MLDLAGDFSGPSILDLPTETAHPTLPQKYLKQKRGFFIWAPDNRPISVYSDIVVIAHPSDRGH